MGWVVRVCNLPTAVLDCQHCKYLCSRVPPPGNGQALDASGRRPLGRAVAMSRRGARGVTSRSPLAIKSSRGDVFATSAVTLRLSLQAHQCGCEGAQQHFDNETSGPRLAAAVQPCRGGGRPVRTIRLLCSNPSCCFRRSPAPGRHCENGWGQARLFLAPLLGFLSRPVQIHTSAMECCVRAWLRPTRPSSAVADGDKWDRVSPPGASTSSPMSQHGSSMADITVNRRRANSTTA